MMLFTLLLATASMATTVSKTVVMSDGSEVVYNEHTGFNGHLMQAYFKYGSDGRPTAFGLKLSTDLDGMFPPAGSPTQEFPTFPKASKCASAMPWDHAQVNYNPKGHPGGFSHADERAAFAKMATDPTAVDTLIGTKSTWFQRHIDVHFSIVSEADALAIQCQGGFPPCKASPQEAAEFGAVPSDMLPPGYFNSPIAWVPGMGAHNESPTGQTYAEFEKHFSFIMGSYNNKIQFWESMVTMTAFESLKQDRKWKFSAGTPKTGRRLNKDYPLAQPMNVDQTGYYPTDITFSKDGFFGTSTAKAYTIEWTGLTFRNAPGDTVTEASQCPMVAHGCNKVKGMFKDALKMHTHCKSLGYCKAKLKTKKGRSRASCKKLKCTRIKKSPTACVNNPLGCSWNPVTKKCSSA